MDSQRGQSPGSGEAAQRGLLRDGCRILAAHGQGDLIWGHASLRMASDPALFLMKPHYMGLEEIQSDDLIIVDLAGRKICGDRPLHIEVFIHSETLLARPDVGAVVHTHAPHAVAFSALGRPLPAISNAAALFSEGLPVFGTTTRLIVNRELGMSVAKHLAHYDAMLLRNHGIVTVGQSLEEAVMRAIFLETACRIQLLAASAGDIRHASTPEDSRMKRDALLSHRQVHAAFEYLRRSLERQG